METALYPFSRSGMRAYFRLILGSWVSRPEGRDQKRAATCNGRFTILCIFINLRCVLGCQNMSGSTSWAIQLPFVLCLRLGSVLSLHCRDGSCQPAGR
jgi:hypothetical protein